MTRSKEKRLKYIMIDGRGCMVEEADSIATLLQRATVPENCGIDLNDGDVIIAKVEMIGSPKQGITWREANGPPR